MTGPGEQAPKKVKAADGHVYHKSATANATVAPTNQATIENAAKTAGLSVEQIDFVTIVHMEYSLKGMLPDTEYMDSEYGYDLKELTALYNDPVCIKALDERGVTINAKQLEPVGVEVRFEAAKASKHAPKLTPLQLVIANTLLDLSDTRSHAKKLKDAGVSTAKYNMWLKDPNFYGYLHDRAEGLLGDGHHDALMALMDKVRAGDTKALSMYFEMTGRFVPASASGNNQSTTHDLQNIIVRIIEIILDEVDDPKVASAIAERLKGLVTGAQVAGMLTAPEPPVIVKPEIAQARELTPEVETMMSKGLGYQS